MRNTWFTDLTANYREALATPFAGVDRSSRFWLLLLALVYLLIFSACGETPTPTQPIYATDTPRTTQTAPPTRTPLPSITPQQAPTLDIEPSDLKGLVVSLWHPWSGATGEAIRRSVQAFNAENEFGIIAEQTYQGNFDDLYAKIEAAIVTGDLPDLGIAYDYQIANWQPKGVIVDMHPYVNDRLWGISPPEQADFFPIFWEQDIAGEKRIGFPALRSAQLLYYNTTWAREIGFDGLPTTPDEFKQQACAAARANQLDAIPDNDGTGGWVVNTAPSAVFSWLQAFGSDVVQPGVPGYRFDTPQVEEALTFLKQLYDAGCAWQVNGGDTGPGYIEGQYAEQEFATRRALFVTGSLADLPYQVEALTQAGNDDRWTVIPFPAPDKKPAINVYGPSFVMFTASPQKQLAAWLLIKWLSSPEQQARLVEASSTFATRAASLEYLHGYAAEYTQWAAAQDLLPYARSEPQFASWEVVRWILGDVGTQLFRSYYTADRIPDTLELMDEIAAELHGRTR